MKRTHLALAGLAAVALVGTVASSASAWGPPSGAHRTPRTGATQVAGSSGSTRPAPDGGTASPTECPPPPPGQLGSIQVKGGKVYVDGKVVGTAPTDGQPLIVAMKDGHVYIGKDAEKAGLPSPPPLPGKPGRGSGIRITTDGTGQPPGPVTAGGTSREASGTTSRDAAGGTAGGTAGGGLIVTGGEDGSGPHLQCVTGSGAGGGDAPGHTARPGPGAGHPGHD